jgi:hypothetical protein
MIDYFQSNGTDTDYMNRTDHWGECTPELNQTRCPVGDYAEKKIGLLKTKKELQLELFFL